MSVNSFHCHRSSSSPHRSPMVWAMQANDLDTHHCRHRQTDLQSMEILHVWAIRCQYHHCHVIMMIMMMISGQSSLRLSACSGQ